MIQTWAVSFDIPALYTIVIAFAAGMLVLLVAGTVAIGMELVTLRMERRRISRHRPRPCPRCRYDLTGNVSGICPECGTKLA